MNCYVIQKKDLTLNRWWARRTRSSSDLIFLFVSFACHIRLNHTIVCLTSPLSFFNTRVLEASITPDNWLESEKLSVYWTAECNENDWLDYDLQGLVKLRYAIIAITLSQLLKLSDGIDEIGRDPVELFLIFLQLQWLNWSCWGSLAVYLKSLPDHFDFSAPWLIWQDPLR